METRRIDAIKIGKRSRTVFSGIEQLAKSIQELGLLQPIGIRPDGTLVCGQRRIMAMRELKEESVAVHVCHNLEDELRLLEAERDENVERQPLTPSDAETQASRLAKHYAPVAKAAQKEAAARGKEGGRGKKKTLSGTSTKGLQDNAKRTAARAAKTTGYSEKTLRKVAEIKEAAKAHPNLYGGFLDDLKQTVCKVDRVYKAYMDTKRKEETRVKAVSARKHNKTIAEPLVQKEDFRDWIPTQRGVKAIIVDPPYIKDAIPLYKDLAEASSKAVKAGAVLAVMCGQSYVPQILSDMSEHVPYLWMFAYLTPGGQAVQLWKRKVNTFWKPVLIFGSLPKWAGDVVTSDVNDNDKQWHKWGQSVSGMRNLIERLTSPGDLIVDPMSGAGTTGVAAIGSHRKFKGCDIDQKAVNTANDRIDAMRMEMT
jgi:ParB-like chromosome segregation protein Spo0J